jgi:histidyl-tRNA synthetase
LGADEVESGQVAVKNLLSGEQVKIARADVPEKVQKILAGD